jgi:hypothetical protein
VPVQLCRQADLGPDGPVTAGSLMSPASWPGANTSAQPGLPGYVQREGRWRPRLLAVLGPRPAGTPRGLRRRPCQEVTCDQAGSLPERFRQTVLHEDSRCLGPGRLVVKGRCCPVVVCRPGRNGAGAADQASIARAIAPDVKRLQLDPGAAGPEDYAVAIAVMLLTQYIHSGGISP